MADLGLGSEEWQRKNPEIVNLANDHAHALGRANVDLCFALWEKLNPQARAEAFAGLSHRFFEVSEETRFQWIDLAQSEGCDISFEVVSAVETICNLIAAGLLEKMDLLEHWKE